MESKPRILIVHNKYQVTGGEDTVVENEKRLLEQNGHDVFSYTRDNSELKTMGLFQKICLPFGSIFSLKTYHEIKQIIKKKQIDIVHVHNTLALISPSVYYAAFSCKIPVVQTIHNFRLLCPAATFYRNGQICEECLSKGLKAALIHNCYRNSKLQTFFCVLNLKIHRLLGTYKKLSYICLTEFSKDKLLSLNYTQRRLLINPNHVFIKPNFTFGYKKIEETIKATDRDFYLYIGRIENLKGIPLLVNAFQEMDGKSLVLVGSGELYSQYLADKTNFEKQDIFFLGEQNHEKVGELLAKAKALIFPTQCYENLPMVIIESFSQGTPVIGSNLGNSDYLIEHGKTGLKFDYKEVASLKSAIADFEVMDSELMSQNAWKEYYQKYSSHKNYELLKAIYLKLLAEKID